VTQSIMDEVYNLGLLTSLMIYKVVIHNYHLHKLTLDVGH